MADRRFLSVIPLSSSVLFPGGAHRAGIRHILLPAQNRDDLADLPAEVTNDLEFDFVEDLSEVFRITLRPT